MKRCVPQLIREGKTKDQAVATCLSMFRKGEDMAEDFEIRSEVTKVDTDLGLVLGTAIVCTQGGEPYFDKQGDHIPEDAMLEAATDFMLHSRASKNMHSGEDVGQVVFAFPLTADIAKAYGIETPFTGLLVAVKPDANTLEKYRSGEYTGFSIGGKRLEDEDVEG